MKILRAEMGVAAARPEEFPQGGAPEIALLGRSNVGKSSLLNRLAQRKKLARTSTAPGKTRLVHWYRVERPGSNLALVDLPGYGYAKVSKTLRSGWQKTIFTYIEERERLEGVIQLVDSRHPPTKDDLMMIQRLVDSERNFIVVFTKSDKISGNGRQKVLSEFRSFFDGFTIGLYSSRRRDEIDIPVVFSSAKTGEGKDAVWSWIGETV